MNTYTPRIIQFKELLEINDWKIKIYTITKDGNFTHHFFYQNVLKELPDWLKVENGFNDNNEKMGFLILHPASEGIFSLINWWVGDNMLNTNVYLTEHDKPTKFEKISGQGLHACVWELEIINHERISWINNFLKSAPHPQFRKYIEDVINTEI